MFARWGAAHEHGGPTDRGHRLEVAARWRRRIQAVLIDGTALTCAALARAASSPVEVTLAPSARARAHQSFLAAVAAARRQPVYGRSTGVGANRVVEVEVNDPDQAMRLLRSHATSAGPLRDPRRVRALLLVRLNQLTNGGSGINPVVLDALVDLINADTLPPVREWGGIGTGDLSALATVALTMSRGQVSSAQAVDGDVHATFGPGDALPFISSNAATIADAALAWADLYRVADAAMVVATLSLVAARGNAEAVNPAAASAAPFPGANRACRVVSSLLRPAPAAARLQDPYAFRAFPQVHGAFLDALTRLRETTEAMANVASENPLVEPDAAGGAVTHHGGFHASALGQALDSANGALVPAARLALTRLTALSSPVITGATPFLADDIAGSSGIMVLEYVAACALGALLATANPVATHTVTLSLGAEEGANFAPTAARSAVQAVRPFETIIGAELVAAIRALRLRDVVLPEPLADVMSVCADLPTRTHDRDLTEDLDAAVAILATLSRFAD